MMTMELIAVSSITDTKLRQARLERKLTKRQRKLERAQKRLDRTRAKLAALQTDGKATPA